eukprot:TRINITY_DN6835_c0_g1_i1.p1 TRINITY_DN6835_c0_g1~~TRINITY_DN6835_c0_g1_i1.p1  ORF type:complete len:313 (+),score=86.17 TRINITY_DN6835_c0_g1_i1:95-940(+)
MAPAEAYTSFRVGVINQEDLDRDFSLAFSSVFKWMQSARMRMPWVGVGYRALSAEEPPLARRLVVKQQVLRTHPGALAEAGGKDIVVECRLGAVGKSSVPFTYRLLADGQEIGTGEVVMICVAGQPGALKPSPVPQRVRDLSAASVAAAPPRPAPRLPDVPKQPPITGASADSLRGAGAFAYHMTVRYSDEDVNKHANHSASARFVYDAKAALAAARHPYSEIAQRPAQIMLLEYVRESRAGDQLVVHLGHCPGGGLYVHITRDQDLLVRGWVGSLARPAL